MEVPQIFAVSYKNYRGLCTAESYIIKEYYETYDISLIANMVRLNADMTQGMRDFIGDILLGKIKRPNGKRTSERRRDKSIYREVTRLLEKGKHLTPNKELEDCAIDIVAEKFNLQSDAVVKAYYRIKSTRHKYGIKYFNGKGQIIDQMESDDDILSQLPDDIWSQ
jgi:hypothetical protein